MVTTNSTFILIILGNLMLISIPNNILAQLTEQEFESIEKEIESDLDDAYLNEMINEKHYNLLKEKLGI